MKRRQFLQVAAAAAAGFRLSRAACWAVRTRWLPASGSRWASSAWAARAPGTCWAAPGPTCRAATSPATTSRCWPSATCARNAANRRTSAATRSTPRSSARPATTASKPTTISAKSSPGPTSTPCCWPCPITGPRRWPRWRCGRARTCIARSRSAITVREGRNLVDTCQRFGRIYQAGTQQRSEYGGKFRLACELVRNGRIGQLKRSTPTASPARSSRPAGPRTIP